MLTITINNITLIFSLTIIIVIISATFTVGALRSYWRSRDMISAILLGWSSIVLVSETWALLTQATQLNNLDNFLAWLELLRWLRLGDRIYKVTVLVLIIYAFKIIRENHNDNNRRHPG